MAYYKTGFWIYRTCNEREAQIINLDFFMQNDFIQGIANNRRWTVSTSKKKPIDMNVLRSQGKVVGASFKDGNMPLVDLYDVRNILPNAANATYSLHQALDNFVVLDIEPKCPQKIRDSLLTLPYLYGELSMSGKGFHLIFRKPSTRYKEILMSKTAVREENGYYEFLLTHYVTFTGMMLRPTEQCIFQDISKMDELFDDIAKTKKLSINTEMNPDSIPKLNDIVYGKTIASTLKRAVYGKTLSDFKNDNSAYEFGVIGFYMHNLDLLLSTTKYNKQEYMPPEKVRILYTVVSDVIPHRIKHEEFRNGIPMLMYSCMRAMTRVEVS